MTIKETERLAVLENKVDDMKEDMSEVKTDIKIIKDLIVGQNERFVTKKSIVTMITIATAIIVAVVTVANFVSK